MTATSPQIDERLRAAMPKSYVRAADGSLHEAPWFPYLAADGGIVSTAADMSRYARMLLALLAWLLYYNGLLLGRAWIGQGKLAAGFGLWWVYVPALAIAAWLIWNGERLKAPQQGRRA